MTREFPANLSGKVLTVCGAVDPSALGLTLVHEHLLIDSSFYFKAPSNLDDAKFVGQRVNLENLYWIRKNCTSNFDNMKLDDEAVALKELALFRAAGGATIVDAGSVGLARDPLGLVRISRTSGLNVVMGCGYYVQQSHAPDLKDRTEEEIEEEIVRDVLVGVDGTGVRAGIIGELGCSWPLDVTEEKVLRAGARAQRRTGAPLSVHIGRHHAAPIEDALILRRSGANMSKVVVCHLDRDLPDYSTLRTLAEMGCFLEFDMFGQETSDYPYTPIDRIPDWQRVHVIRDMIAEGLLDHIVVSHDVAHKHRLASYGGHGYAHLPISIVPLMRRKGIKDEHIEQILVKNPARLMRFE